MATLQAGDSRAGFIEVTTLGDCVDRAASVWSHDALVFPDERVTFPELAARADHFARALIAMGVVAGDKVGIRMAPGVDYFVALLGVAKAGGVAVPVNARFKAAELAHVVTNADMRVLIGSPDGREVGDHRALLVEALPSLQDAKGPELDLDEAPELRRVVVVAPRMDPWSIGVEELSTLAACVSAADMDARRLGVRVRDTAVLMYTSGTTANPKGAMLSHEALIRQGIMVARTRFLLTSRDAAWTPLPLYHIGGLSVAVACWSVGATYCHSGQFDPAVAARQLREERCTVAVPAFEMLWGAVLDQPEFDVAGLHDLRLVYNVGVPERLRGFQERVPQAVQVSGFGSTEACGFMTLGDIDDDVETRIHTSGRPLAGLELRLVDPDTGADVESGVTGEILYKGWSTFDGYYNDPQRNAEVFDHRGFFHSGDLGVLDEDGRLRFIGRLKDMMKVGGENVAAAEVEGFLLRHPAVAVVQVVAAPDARYGEVAAAFVELAPGAGATEQELIDFCLGSIATFKVPRYVRFVEEWPMSGTKVKKYVLREQMTKELADAGITEAPKLSARPSA